VTRGEDDQVVAKGLHGTHLLAVGHLGVGEQAGKIVARILAAVLNDPIEELVELES